MREAPPPEKFDVVTCLETAEHLPDLGSALSRILAITSKFLLITVPIEIGAVGIGKVVAKTLLGREVIGKERTGSRWQYLNRLLSGGDISSFRTNCHAGYWMSHTGFDYRRLDQYLHSLGVKFRATNRGWNRFYLIRPQ